MKQTNKTKKQPPLDALSSLNPIPEPYFQDVNYENLFIRVNITNGESLDFVLSNYPINSRRYYTKQLAKPFTTHIAAKLSIMLETIKLYLFIFY